MIFRPTPAQEMRFRISLLSRNTANKNELGETCPRLTSIATVWAKVSPINAKEVLANAQNTLDVTHEVRCRYLQELTHADVIQFRGRQLEIVSLIDLEEQHVELAMLCHEEQ